ncbi:unnamed protein product [Schistosoma margrebowiei]|uniref:Uncharacterized protein n=1 Tax=Schistosoma margrebowiei TaxID=48269 RepID=A0AA85AAH3_9TREM|nr:unnamed protein product [Schistosoma margrebowiei]
MKKTFCCYGKTKKWLFHFISFILCLTLLLYRTFEWLKAYHFFIDDYYHMNGFIYYLQNSYFNKQNMNNKDHYHHHHYHPHQQQQLQEHQHHYQDNMIHSDNTTLMEPNVIIRLCNINPMRLSALFSLFNGSDIYTYLITKYGKIDMINLLNDTYLTPEQIKHMAHPLSTTLKSCQYGDDQCTINDFISIFTTHGWCYQFHLNFSRNAELKLILDPQEYDYIIPNKGYVGFYLTVQNLNCSPRQQFNMNNNNNDQSIIVGPKFHSYISIQQQYFVRSGNHFGTNIKDICPAYNIQSVVQLEKLPIQIHLLQKFNTNLFKRNGTVVQYGILYQQKAFLQIYNRTAYDLIKNLSKELYQAKLLTKFTIQSIWNLYKYLKYFNPIKSIHNTINYNHHHYCYTKVYQLFISISKDILSRNTLSNIDPDPDQDQDDDDHYHHEENQYFMNNHTLDHIELQLINSFFETKVIVSPSSSLLRKILTVVMKFRYLLSNYSNLSSTIISNKNKSSMLNINSFMDNTTQFILQFNVMNCSHLITYYNEQINKCGETASGALTRLDHVNLQLHNLIKNNHFIRLIYPKHSYPYTELSISNMVSLSIRLSKFNVPTFHESSTFHIDIYLKSKLLL